MTVDEAIEDIVRRLVAYYRPERIYLFGSAARNEFGPDSDLDFCVVLPDNAPQQLFRSGAIYRHYGAWAIPRTLYRGAPAISTRVRSMS